MAVTSATAGMVMAPMGRIRTVTVADADSPPVSVTVRVSVDVLDSRRAGFPPSRGGRGGAAEGPAAAGCPGRCQFRQRIIDVSETVAVRVTACPPIRNVPVSRDRDGRRRCFRSLSPCGEVRPEGRSSDQAVIARQCLRGWIRLSATDPRRDSKCRCYVNDNRITGWRRDQPPRGGQARGQRVRSGRMTPAHVT